MGNVLTYLRWRGDLDFTERAFCEVDNLVLSILAYTDYQNIVPPPGCNRAVTIQKAVEQYHKEHENIEFLEVMGASKRFRDARLSRYVNLVDDKKNIQFSAMQIELGDGTVYIAFRGTDDTLTGWREDFSISFQVVPAQREAVKYLEESITRKDCIYYVGGHSKGGNLALYASMMCDDEKKQYIQKVYNNDGPGICEEMLDECAYKKIQSKVLRIVPEFSVFGNLFVNKSETLIVGSSAPGLNQHDAKTWQVSGDRFCEKESLTEKCIFYNDIFDQWLESVDPVQRKAFVQEFFDALELSGSKTRSGLSGMGLEGFETILFAMAGSEKNAKNVVGKLFQSFFENLRHVDFLSIFRSNSFIKGLILILLGICFVMQPKAAINSIPVIIGVFCLFQLSRRLMVSALQNTDTKRKRQEKKYRLLLYLALSGMITFVIANHMVRVRMTDFIVGAFLIYEALSKFKLAAVKDSSALHRGIEIFVGVVLLIFGGITFIAASLILNQHIVIGGIVMGIYGILEIGWSVYSHEQRAKVKLA